MEDVDADGSNWIQTERAEKNFSLLSFLVVNVFPFEHLIQMCFEGYTMTFHLNLKMQQKSIKNVTAGFQ